MDRESNLIKISKKADVCEESYAGGNRANLLFVETCLDHIQETPSNNDDPAIYESAILGLQSGHFESVNRICNFKFKDNLWSHFKSAST